MQVGCRSEIDFGTRIWLIKKTKLVIGQRVMIRSCEVRYHGGMPFKSILFIDRENAEINIGDYTRINGACLHAKKKIVIGKKCVIASGVQIIDQNGHMLNSINRIVRQDEPESIIIGDNVWIGLNVVVLKELLLKIIV